jgi:Ca2+-binding RTX toxin-like protein
VVSKGTAGTDQLVSIERIVGATGQANLIDASTATGTATINANLATKSLVVNTGDSRFPTLNFGVTNFANVIGTANSDAIAGDDANNSLVGGSGNDTLNGGGGDDALSGGDGDDFLDGGFGFDTINGGMGNDTTSYAFYAGPIVANLAAGVVSFPGNSLLTDSLISIENLIGTNGNDSITGNGDANSLSGALGNDTIIGGIGNDALDGGAGNDTIIGDLTTSITTPIFSYNNKYYTLSTAGTWAQAQAQAVSLGGNLVTVNDAAENQFLVKTFGGTERLWIGFTDEVTEGVFKWANGETVTYTNWAPGEPNNAGNEDYAEFNFGGAGRWNDLPGLGYSRRGIIEIGSSADTLVGGLGSDTLTGGLGNDVFRYTSVTESAAGVTNRDTITDFQVGLDKLDLSAIDANPFLSLDQAFGFLGSSATFTNVGQLRYQVSGGNLFLYGNIDANLATSEFELQLTGLAAISASNIML